MSKKSNRGWTKPPIDRNYYEGHPISLGFESRVEACGETPTENGFICTGKKLYRLPLPSTYKETEVSEDLKYGM